LPRQKCGLAAMDAPDLAVALRLRAREFVTTAISNKP
jgi:hypothetical protein